MNGLFFNARGLKKVETLGRNECTFFDQDH